MILIKIFGLLTHQRAAIASEDSGCQPPPSDLKAATAVGDARMALRPDRRFHLRRSGFAFTLNFTSFSAPVRPLG